MEEGDSYDIRLLCGRHWRLAPKYMREAVTRVRRMARKHGWSDNLCGRHHRLWNRCLRAIKEAGNLDIARIEREFGL